MNEAVWRCRIRKGSVRPKASVAQRSSVVVPFSPVTQLVHEEFSQSLLSFANDLDKDACISGYALIAMDAYGEAWANVRIASNCVVPRDIWPAFVSRKVGEVVGHMNEWLPLE